MFSIRIQYDWFIDWLNLRHIFWALDLLGTYVNIIPMTHLKKLTHIFWYFCNSQIATHDNAEQQGHNGKWEKSLFIVSWIYFLFLYPLVCSNLTISMDSISLAAVLPLSNFFILCVLSNFHTKLTIRRASIPLSWWILYPCK